MKTVEANAKTREEAIQNALDEMGVELSDVDDIKILDEGSKGFLGFGARPVRVQVSVEKLHDDPAPKERNDERGSRGRGRGGAKREDPQDTRGEEQRDRGDRGGRGGRNDRGRGRGGEGGPGENGGRRPKRDGERAKQGKGASSRGESKPKPKPKPKQTRQAAPESSAVKPEEERPVEDVYAGKAALDENEVCEAIPDELGNEAAALLQEIIGKMGLDAKVAFARVDDGTARLNVESEDSAILIGRKGRNLGAMQYLINRMVSRSDAAENTERLAVDVEGYIDRRRATLADMAQTFARRAKDQSRNMRLKPMSPQERRIIHLTLQDDPDVRTFSLGESLYRSVVISPKDAKPERSRPPRSRGRGGRGGRGRNNRGDRGRRENNRQDGDTDAGQFGD